MELLKYRSVTIEYTKSLKYLILLYPKLHWKLHITKQIGKTFASLWVCKRAISRSWSFSPKISLWLYKMVLLPRLTYTAEVWWPHVLKGGGFELVTKTETVLVNEDEKFGF